MDTPARDTPARDTAARDTVGDIDATDDGRCESCDATDDGRCESCDATAGVSGPPDVTKRLLDAAVAAFAEHGFEAARVAQIAHRAGLTTGAIYSRWPGKRALIVDAVRHIVPQCMHLPAAAAGMSAAETLSAVGADLISTDKAWVRDVMLEALVSARRDDGFRAAVSHSMNEEAVKLSAVVSKGKAEGSIDPDLSTHAIVALYQALGLGMHLVASSQPDDGHVPVAEWDALVRRLIAAVSPSSATD